jgi:hypothetical protein
MSDEDFLSRWSRRKREADQSARGSAEQSAAPAATEALPSATASPAVAETTEPAKPEEEFDLASLPPLDSITGTTDITAFLRKGVPLELSRAALRRAWASDPMIRDFIGPAENAWDFNDPNAMPGFGPLDQTPEQVHEWAQRIVGRVRDAADELMSGSEQSQPVVGSDNSLPRMADPPAVSHTSAASARPEEGTIVPDASSAAPEQSENAAAQDHKSVLTLRRTHGGALPR